MARYIEGSCSVVDVPKSSYDRLNDRISNVNSRINKLSSDKADTERVDNIDSTIEEIIEVIIPSLIDDGMDESEDL